MFYESVTFWIVAVIIVFFGVYRFVPVVGPGISQFLKTLGGPQKAVWIFVIAGVLLTGIYADFGFGSITKSVSASSFEIATYSLPAGAGVGTSCAITQDTSRDNVVTMQCTDAQSYGTIADLNSTSVVIQRSDCSKADSLTIEVVTRDYKSPSAPTDTNMYNLLDNNAAGNKLFYLGSSEVTTSSQKESIEAGFAEGTCTYTLHIGGEFSEAGTDEFNQYDREDILFLGDSKRLFTI